MFPRPLVLSVPKALALRFPIHLHRFHSFHCVLINILDGIVVIPLDYQAQPSSELCHLLKFRTAPLELYRDFTQSHLLQSFVARSKLEKIIVDFLTPQHLSSLPPFSLPLPLKAFNLNFLFHQAANQTIYLHTRSDCPIHFLQHPKANRYLRHDSSLRP